MDARALRGERGQILNPALLNNLRMEEYVRDAYRTSVSRVEPLPGESALESRMREICYLHLTHFVRILLDRKDRTSMAVGLEVRVPFCDHRLVEYVYNTPWALKTYDGREKSLLRGAARDLLPDSVIQRVKSPYPSTQDWHYTLDLQMQGRELLGQPAHRTFEVIDRAWLDAAARSDPRAIAPADRQGLEWTLNLATWLDVYQPRLVL